MTLLCRSWFIDIRGFARKVKNTTLSTADQIKDCGTYRKCPKCHYHIDNSDVRKKQNSTNIQSQIIY
ncbi:hypothetical protein Fmac_016967 [Flemingia macrophylla]|uniref:Uncharacterized protein n=1 Tax=Flemingia macrophylla TaxID=520843 RepID=A0ABD1MIX3_9FABA